VRVPKALSLRLLILGLLTAASAWAQIGREVAMERRLANGEEYLISIAELIQHGRRLFTANWTSQEGAGRPLSSGTGTLVADPFDPLVFPRNFNRISAPDANSCAGCHNIPFAGGAGDIVTNVFVLAQRFDFATFDPADTVPTKGTLMEDGHYATLRDIGNSRSTPGMGGAGYLEMLARQITEDLQAIRDALAPGQSAPLISKGISFGFLSRRADGAWNVLKVEGLPALSLRTTGPQDPPSLTVLPWHQAGAVVSLRQFSNNAFNHHHGIQSTERFGEGTDPDGDGFTDEMSRAEVTAVSVFQATLPVPGRVIPRQRAVEEAVLLGERLFEAIGCASCHLPALPLERQGWMFVEPNPFNPAGNLQTGQAPDLEVDLNDPGLPGARLAERHGVVWVPAYTDFKLHDITRGPDDPNREPLNMHFAPGSVEFFAGNSRFLTRRLWDVGSRPARFHHGLFTTIREAILAHAGDAQEAADAFRGLTDYERDSIIEFLKSLQALPPETKHGTVDEHFRPRPWPHRRQG
jgi:hypothetical protein